MTDTSEAIVLEDADGAYYVIPRETLEDARVPDSAKAAVDEDLGETQGFQVGAANFSFVGALKLTPQRVGSAYNFRGMPWPCDAPQIQGGISQQ